MSFEVRRVMDPANESEEALAARTFLGMDVEKLMEAVRTLRKSREVVIDPVALNDAARLLMVFLEMDPAKVNDAMIERMRLMPLDPTNATLAAIPFEVLLVVEPEK